MWWRRGLVLWMWWSTIIMNSCTVSTPVDITLGKVLWCPTFEPYLSPLNPLSPLNLSSHLYPISLTLNSLLLTSDLSLSPLTLASDLCTPSPSPLNPISLTYQSISPLLGYVQLPPWCTSVPWDWGEKHPDYSRYGNRYNEMSCIAKLLRSELEITTRTQPVSHPKKFLTKKNHMDIFKFTFGPRLNLLTANFISRVALFNNIRVSM